MALRPILSLGLLLGLAVSAGWAQAPTGIIAGVVNDESGAAIPNAAVTVTNKDTGLVRSTITSLNGTYSVPALPAGNYEVKTEAPGFRSMVRSATVVTGSTVTVDLAMQVGATKDVVTVEGASSQLVYDSSKIDAVVTRAQIENLPLNGRSFLQLAFLQPGVSVAPQTLSQYNAQFSVSILGGAANMTAIAVDGGNVRNAIEGNTGQNFSQEVVEEFQISSANFDLSTGITGVGAINIVTRSGGNDFHGSGYFFFRDHNMSAYPALKRNDFNADPFFARRQSGFWVGGPIKRDRLFFFFNLEHNNQASVVTVQPNSPFFAGLAQNTPSPYRVKLLSQRFDYRINASHTLFLRYSHDGNSGFGPNGGAPLPSNWLRNTNWSDQSIAGVTSTLRPNLVNDFRFSYWYWQNRNLFPREQDCPGCIGLGLPEMSIIGTNVQFGNTSNATQGRDLRRYVWSDNMSWQRGSHRFQWGGEIEHAPGTGFWGFAEPASGAVYGPDILGAAGRAAFGIPSSFNTTADLLKLPVYAFSMGVGDPSQPPPYNVDIAKNNNRFHLYWQDTWRVHPRFTVNYGLAWSFESTLVNHDLDKPKYLAPVLGAGGIQPTDSNYHNFSPAVGFAWSLTRDQKTVLRAGAGIYYDTRLLWQRLRERSLIGPLGNGRVLISGSAVPNPVPGLPGAPQGAPLDFRQGPTGFTLGQLVSILPSVRAQLERQVANLNPTFDLSVRGIEVAKNGVDLIPRHYPEAYSEHYTVGIQRELRRNLVVTADFVGRQFVHQEIGSLDYNRYFRVAGPVLPACIGAQAADPKAPCSTGSITVRTPAGRSNYKALLVKVDKRFANRYQLTASYALADQHGMNGLWNLDNWFSTWGPQGSRHLLNVSGFVDLPWKFQVSFISSMATRGPVMPSIPIIDLDGDGTSGEPLPGASFNGFNRGLGKDDLTRLVDQFNQTWAGKKTVRNQTIPRLALPANYEFGKSFSSQDLRLTKNFQYHERYKLSIFGEVFNLFNIANLGGYSFDLTSPGFGQPTSRAGQVFGSGGPRAFQVGARVSF
ncbi:MAG: TonB-dependent receptor [Acidobacteria bacterium]|nr:TonB-dependent receptor [Acidobacteriota bacterium]